MKKIFALPLLFVLALCTSCSHTVDFPTGHFAVPYVSENRFGGSFSGSSAQSTAITFIEDYETTPPTRGTVQINKDVDFADFLLVDDIGVEIDLSLGTLPVEYFKAGGVSGLRWQVIGHGSGKDHLVASIQAGVGSFSSSSSKSTASVSSKVNTNQMGASVGYKKEDMIIYVSHLKNDHKVDTTVVNASTTYDGYQDTGVHTTTAIGLSTYAKGFLMSLEYNNTNIEWNSSVTDTQGNWGFRLGYSW